MRQKSAITVLFLGFTIAQLSACGTTGALYMPGTPPPIEQRPRRPPPPAHSSTAPIPTTPSATSPATQPVPSNSVAPLLSNPSQEPLPLPAFPTRP